MSIYLSFLVLGLTFGAVYAVLGTSVIALYRATGIVNFAQGAMAMWGAYVFARLCRDGELVLPVGAIGLTADGGLGVWPSFAIAVVVSLALGALAHLLVFRPLHSAPLLAQVIASVGVLLTLQALVVLRFGSTGISVPATIEPASWELWGESFGRTPIYLAMIAIVWSALIWLYFSKTRWGVATRGGSQNEQALRLLGYSPNRLAMIVWTVTSGACGAVAVLAAPSIGLSSINFSLFIVPALAAALAGRLVSVGTACAFGLGLGSFQSLLTYLTTQQWWPEWAKSGIQEAVPFLVIVVVLFLVGDRIPTRGSAAAAKSPRVYVPVMRLPVVIGTAVVVLVGLLLTSGSYRFALVTSVILVLLALSIVVLTGFLGQISLAQTAIAGVAGLVVSKATISWGLPFPVSLIVAATVATLAGVLVGVPALRIRGIQLSVVTLAGATAIDALVLQNPVWTPLEGHLVSSPTFLGIDLSVREPGNVARLSFAIAVLIVVGVMCWIVGRILGGATGAAFLAVKSNERAAESAGLNAATVKLIGYALAAFTAGVAGALIAYSRAQFAPESFSLVLALAFFAIVYLGGITSFSGAVIAAVIGPLGIVYVVLNVSVDLGEYYALISGISLVLTALINPAGVAGTTREVIETLVNKRRQNNTDAATNAEKEPVNV